MPENIGKEELADYTIDNYFSASVQGDNTTSVTRDAGSTDSLNTFSGELSLYALTGSFEKYFASQAEAPRSRMPTCARSMEARVSGSRRAPGSSIRSRASVDSIDRSDRRVL